MGRPSTPFGDSTGSGQPDESVGPAHAYKQLATVGVRNVDGYNALAASEQSSRASMGRELKFIPHIVIIIDELADLMMVARNEVEEYIIRLAQMARAVGMHLVLATQRPSVNVITGIIKANFPSRIAFQVSSKVDSRTILDINGAEALMGRGDMLYSPGGVKPFRIQGAFVSDAEVERLTDYIRDQERDGHWWTAKYTKDQGADHGALFCTFNAHGDADRARCHFRDIRGRVPDRFEIINAVTRPHQIRDLPGG